MLKKYKVVVIEEVTAHSYEEAAEHVAMLIRCDGHHTDPSYVIKGETLAEAGQKLLYLPTEESV